ncbi:MAG TPA: DUF692 domain-containing protein [Pyrinomonadaceae bacterium]|nr:DUF692 domain-containing protein [Pyrinomonadaceae bacterium]
MAQKLGVGLLFNPALHSFVTEQLESFDYLEIIPDREWLDRGVNSTSRYALLDKSFTFFQHVREERPIVCHAIGLSIGSAALFDKGHVEQIGRMHDELSFAWHSDHLSFARLPQKTPEMHTAISLPVPYDKEVLDLLIERVTHIRAVVPCPFLLENNVYYVDVPDQEMAEAEFLNRLARESGCGILLDLHNVYVNSRNHGFAPESFLRDLDLSRVVEIHIAGGDTLLNFYTDSHAGPVAEPVWDLLEQTLRAAPGIRGVTFEFHESYYPLLKVDGIRAELDHARKIWERCC